MNQNTSITPAKSNVNCRNTEQISLLEDHITESLLKLGFKAALKGYVYTKESIYYYVNTPFVDSMRKDIYTKVAEQHGTSVLSIERAIRNSIINAWDKTCINCTHELFSWSYLTPEFPPSNSEFIATMAEMIKINMKKEYLRNSGT